MPPAARRGDYHTCPAYSGSTPHVGGPILKGATRVKIGGADAARVTDPAECKVGGPDIITKGSGTVYIQGQKAARVTDGTAHGGKIVQGFPKVVIGG
jgi:uncharacterized Zn-binding protein involved in type VI secretion